MEALLILAVLAFICFVVIAKLKGIEPSKSTEYPYTLQPQFITPAERSFFGVLSSAVGSNASVLAKVRVADVVKPGKGLNKSTWQKAFNRISAKHFDYLLCDPGTLKPIVAIELDDKSHSGQKAKKKDAVKDSVCSSAGLPLLRFTAKHSYSMQELKEALHPHLPGIMPREPEPTPQEVETTPEPQSPESPQCPKCGSGMTMRVSKQGKYAGKKFWGCSTFPACRGVKLADT